MLYEGAVGSSVDMDAGGELPPYATLGDAIQDLEERMLGQSQEEYFVAVDAALRGTVYLGPNDQQLDHDGEFFQGQERPVDSQTEKVPLADVVPKDGTHAAHFLPGESSEMEHASEEGPSQQYSRPSSVLSYWTESDPSGGSDDDDYDGRAPKTRKRKKAKGKAARPKKRPRNNTKARTSHDGTTTQALRPTQAKATPSTSHVQLQPRGASSSQARSDVFLDVSDSDAGAEKENEDPLDSDSAMTSKSFYITHSIDWANKPPKWGHDTIEKMRSNDIAGYLIARYDLDGEMVCRWNDCGKTLKNAATSLVNHLNGATHINRRGNCSGCGGGFSARIDMYKERVKNHACPGRT
ncbi:hypothetical protein C8Q79DRAFT_1015095 [Trametes meyenii]|nr:hypothetical protein C8Q79DRAFT_1015095 [Trametes meyenii]